MKKRLLIVLCIVAILFPMQAWAAQKVSDKELFGLIVREVELQEAMEGTNYKRIDYSSGGAYLGEVNANGIPDGFGVYYRYIDNAMIGGILKPFYEGDFVNNKMTGYGLMHNWKYNPNGQLTDSWKKGIFVDGVLVLKEESFNYSNHIWIENTLYENVLLGMVVDIPYILSTDAEIATKPIDVAPMIISGSTYVPVRDLVEALGGVLDWDAENQRVIIEQDETSLILTVNSDTAIRNGSVIKSSAPVLIHNGRTMLPLRFVSESLGYEVDWNNDYRAIIVYEKEVPEVITSFVASAHDWTDDGYTPTDIYVTTNLRTSIRINLNTELHFYDIYSFKEYVFDVLEENGFETQGIEVTLDERMEYRVLYGQDWLTEDKHLTEDDYYEEY